MSGVGQPIARPLGYYKPITARGGTMSDPARTARSESWC